MSLDLTSPRTAAGPRLLGDWPSRSRRQERRRLAARDRASTRLAELHHLAGLLCRAEEIVAAGWVQGGWFAYLDEAGRSHTVTASSMRGMDGRPVSGACLVGAVVEAGGGIPAAQTQPVHRALDLAWHTLWGRGPLPEQWCPAPSVRAAHIRQLTTWNDHPGRGVDEVTGLLAASAQTAETERARLQLR